MAKWTVEQIPSQVGRLAVVTGANSGIGWHTALELARAGGEVILTARSEVKGKDAVDRIRREVPKAKVRFEILDLASLASVRAFAGRVGSERKLDLLVNNAGVMMVPKREVTEDGFERQMGTNFMGPFAVTGLLLPALLRAGKPRVATVSSMAAVMGLKRIRFEDMQWEKGYNPWNAYCQSKLADLLFAQELERRSVAAGWGLVSTAAHPGGSRTNLQTSGPGRLVGTVMKALMLVMSQDAAAGALPTLRAATVGAGGTYLGPDGWMGIKGSPVEIPVPKPALDAVAAKRLWEIAEKLTGVRYCEN